MVFSSVPLYLDQPSWQQHPHTHHQGGANETQNLHLPPALPPQPDHPGGATCSTLRQSSMADRARLAKIPAPEGPLKCPRCESTNTKFCYFNNYSLSQPRHFCKTCRRYWTRGGALRNIPVGGCCRRANKRRKSSRPKSPCLAGPRQTPARPADSAVDFMLRHVGPAAPPLSLTASLRNLTELGMGNSGFKLGGDGDDYCPGGAQVQVQSQQLPLLGGFGAGLPSSNSLYQFQNEGMGTAYFL